VTPGAFCFFEPAAFATLALTFLLPFPLAELSSSSESELELELESEFESESESDPSSEPDPILYCAASSTLEDGNADSEISLVPIDAVSDQKPVIPPRVATYCMPSGDTPCKNPARPG
jgi:hypothetical protein